MQEETPMTNTLWMGDVSFKTTIAMKKSKILLLSLVIVAVSVSNMLHFLFVFSYHVLSRPISDHYQELLKCDSLKATM